MAEAGRKLPVIYWVVLSLSGLVALAAALAFLKDRRVVGERLALAALGLVIVATMVQNWASRMVRERRH